MFPSFYLRKNNILNYIYYFITLKMLLFLLIYTSYLYVKIILSIFSKQINTFFKKMTLYLKMFF